MNKQALKFTNYRYEDFLQWCKLTHKPAYKPETQMEFFQKINEGLIVRDELTGQIKIKRKVTKR